jgi:hypothetical protein
MRTVTFSDAALAAELDARFACVWVNQRPSEEFKDFRQIAPREVRSLGTGAGVTNVTSIFATPEGRVLNAFPGYLNPETFRAEMELAQEVHRYGFENYIGLHRARSRAYLAPTVAIHSKHTSSVGARAHFKLAQSGFLFLEDFERPFFEELAPGLLSSPARPPR